MKLSSHKFWNSAKLKRILALLAELTILCSLLAVTAYATTTNNDVAGTVQTAFGTYVKPQIMKAVNGVVMPIIDAILSVLFVVFIVMAGVNYKKHSGGDFEWHVPAALFAGLIVSLTAPLWMWSMIGW
jgi:hypothetical protein